MTAATTQLDAAGIRRMHDILARIHRGGDLRAALQDVADGLVDVLGFKTSCIHFVVGDELEVFTLAGDVARAAHLIGRRQPIAAWERVLREAEPLDGVCFMRDPRGLVPDLVFDAASDEDMIGTPQTWGTLNILVAPLRSVDGGLIGLVSVDGHLGSPLPDQLQLNLLEMFTMQAGMVIDKQRLTEQLQHEHDLLRASEERFRLAFDGAPIGMCLLSLDGDKATIAQTNDALCAMLRSECSELIGRSIHDVLPDEEHAAASKRLRRLSSGEMTTMRTETPYRRWDGTISWGLVQTAVLPLGHAGEPVALCQIVDMSSAKEAELALTHLARHDPLTGLANRRLLLDHLDEVVENVRQGGRTGAVLFCDLNHFKTVNDLHGHLVGDHVLAEVASRVSSAVRAADLVGRLGGDEFVVVAHPLTLVEAEEMADRIAAALSEPVSVDQIETGVSASIGMVLITGALGSIEVLRRADAAMYRGKHGDVTTKYVIDTA